MLPALFGGRHHSPIARIYFLLILYSGRNSPDTIGKIPDAIGNSYAVKDLQIPPIGKSCHFALTPKITFPDAFPIGKWPGNATYRDTFSTKCRWHFSALACQLPARHVTSRHVIQRLWRGCLQWLFPFWKLPVSLLTVLIVLRGNPSHF